MANRGEGYNTDGSKQKTGTTRKEDAKEILKKADSKKSEEARKNEDRAWESKVRDY